MPITPSHYAGTIRNFELGAVEFHANLTALEQDREM